MKRNITILNDCIESLNAIRTLISRGRMEEAATDLFQIWQARQQVIGGDAETRRLMDQFDGEWLPLHVATS